MKNELLQKLQNSKKMTKKAPGSTKKTKSKSAKLRMKKKS